jgi:hypothetical protein
MHKSYQQNQCRYEIKSDENIFQFTYRTIFEGRVRTDARLIIYWVQELVITTSRLNVAEEF